VSVCTQFHKTGRCDDIELHKEIIVADSELVGAKTKGRRIKKSRRAEQTARSRPRLFSRLLSCIANSTL